MSRGLPFALGLAACAPGVDSTSWNIPVDTCTECAEASDAETSAPMPPVPLAFAITDDAFEADALRALLSLVEPTGAPLTLDPLGMPVVFVSEIMTPKGATCAFTELGEPDGEAVDGEIYVSLNPPPGCPELWKTLRHEMACHAAGHTRWHTETGVCAESGGGPDVADFASLVWMCEAIGFDLCPLLGSDLPTQ